MAAHARNTSRVSLAMERTGQWIFSQDLPPDVLVQVGEARFPLHKFMLVAKSNYIRRLIIESKEPDMTRLDLSSIPGGAETFEKAAKFCYGVNFEITVHNVAALRCAAEYLDMTDQYCDDNLAGRTDAFLAQVALTSLSGAVVVLKSCEDLVPVAEEEINIVQRCVEVVSAKACNEANFPSRSPPNWWTNELSIVHVNFFEKIIASMKSRGAKPITIASAIITYTERSLPNIIRNHYGTTIKASISIDSASRNQQREILNSIVSLLPVENERASFPISFLCSLLREAIFLENEGVCKKQLEKRISSMLEHVSVDDLLVLSYTFDGERLFDLESVRRIISGFMEKAKSVSVFNGGGLKETVSTTILRVAKTVDAYLGEIATIPELSISKFNGIAILVPKNARKYDDDLYRAIDIFLKAHPTLDEIEREKVCSSMDPFKLSYEARVHASQNKRLPVQIVLHALYFDQLQIRSEKNTPDAVNMRSQVRADISLSKENESLRSELSQMKACISDMQNKTQVGSTSSRIRNTKKPTFFSSMSKKLGKFNPFRHGSKDTSNIEEDDEIEHTKPRRRRFSVS